MNRSLLTGAVVAALAAGAGTGTAAASTVSTTPAAHASSSAPVIHETFTVLPCKGDVKHRTTQEMEGCAEHGVVRSDATINSLAKTIYGKLSRSGRADFVTASHHWLSYRNAECRAASSPEAGGSEQGVVYAQCLQSENGAHVTALRTLLQDSFPAGPKARASGV